MIAGHDRLLPRPIEQRKKSRGEGKRTGSSLWHQDTHGPGRQGTTALFVLMALTSATHYKRHGSRRGDHGKPCWTITSQILIKLRDAETGRQKSARRGQSTGKDWERDGVVAGRCSIRERREGSRGRKTGLAYRILMPRRGYGYERLAPRSMDWSIDCMQTRRTRNQAVASRLVATNRVCHDSWGTACLRAWRAFVASVRQSRPVISYSRPAQCETGRLRR